MQLSVRPTRVVQIIAVEEDLEMSSMPLSRLWSSQRQEDLEMRPRHSARGLHCSSLQSGTIRTAPRWPDWGVVYPFHSWDPQSDASREPTHTQAFLSESHQWIWWWWKPASHPPAEQFSPAPISNIASEVYLFISCFIYIKPNKSLLLVL